MKKPFYFAIVIIVLLSLFEIVPIRSVQAGNEQVVMNANDSGAGSLRQAIVAASNGDIITFDPSLSGQTIHLASIIEIDKSITIDGSSLPSSITISGDTNDDGNSDVQLMNISSSGNLLVQNMIFTKGDFPYPNFFGGIRNLGQLTIIDSEFSYNGGAQGGAIQNSGTLTISNSTFIYNAALEGGAVWNGQGAQATIINCTFSNNSADYGGGVANRGILTVTKSNLSSNSTSSMGAGGGIMNFDTGILTVEDSLISNNSADNGGGIFNFNTATITNSTISENSASMNGGGISTWLSLTLTNSTVVGNNAETGGGVFNLGTLTTTNVTLSGNAATTGGGVYNGIVTTDMTGTFNYSNTIIANSTSGADCYNDGVINTNTNNLVENNAASPNQCNTPSLSEDPKLGLLKNNGGFTQTLELLPSSPAIDAGNDAICASAPVSNASQNGITRPRGSHCDIGAYEHSSIFIVTNTNDNGPGSLRQIITDAYSNFTVTFDPSLAGQTIHLASELVVDKSITIDGSSLTTPITISGDTDNDGDGDALLMSINAGASVAIKNIFFEFGKYNIYQSAGGINNFGNLTISNCNFENNRGSIGGAIFNDIGARAIIENSLFSHNIADIGGGGEGGGGGIGNLGDLTISSSQFSENSALRGGGAIVNAQNGLTIISNSTFTSNSAGSVGGGAIYNIDNVITISSSIFSLNTSTGNGGAIYNATNGTTNLSNVTFTESSTSKNGGAIFNFAGTMNIAYSTFSSNSAGEEGGGAIFNNLNATANIEHSIFSQNTANGIIGGGGAIINIGALGISTSEFSENTATIGGGAIVNHTNGTAIISNTTIAKNLSADGGAIINLEYSTLTLINSTLSQNTGGGLYIFGGIIHLKNSILANNTVQPDCYKSGGNIYTSLNTLIENSAIGINSCGAPLLTGDPYLGPLANNGGSTQTMALLSGSPAIDAGDDATCASAPVSNTSQNGVTRPQGEHCDIGAFEYSTPLPDLIITNVTINPTVPLPNQTFEVSITIKNQGGTGSANTVFRDVYINRDPSTLIDPTTGCPPPGDFFRSDSYTSIPAGMTDTKTVTITGGLPSGNHQFWFYVDSRCLVDEGGGSNNAP